MSWLERTNLFELRWRPVYSAGLQGFSAPSIIRQLEYRSRAIAIDDLGEVRGVGDWSEWTVVPEGGMAE